MGHFGWLYLFLFDALVVAGVVSDVFLVVVVVDGAVMYSIGLA